MAQKPLTLACLLVCACNRAPVYEGAFQLPVAAAVLQPEVGGPFQEPVGFVANGHGGQIIPLALKQGRFLTDDPTASFLRTNPLPTGGLRVLTSVAVTSPTLREVTLWAGDALTGSLLKVPYLYDCQLPQNETRPECESAAQTDLPVEQGVYYRKLGGPGGATPAEGDPGPDAVRVKKGYTTSEEWTLTYRESTDDWLVEGSRSGLEPTPARTGEPYSSQYHRLGFTIPARGAPYQDGAQFKIETLSGLSEHDVGGTPLALSATRDQSLIAMIVHSRASDRPVVRWLDPAAAEIVAEVVLPADAWPHRIAWTEDDQLLVADKEHPAVWEIAPGSTSALEHPLPWPSFDVASLDGDDMRRLFVVPVLTGLAPESPDYAPSELWMFDRDTDTPIDINAALEGTQGLPLPATILGIEALRREHLQPEYTDDAIRRTGRSVAIVLASNRVVFAREDTGCLVQDNLGPRTEVSSTGLTGLGDYDTNFHTSFPSPASLELAGSSGRHVSVNTCAGVAPSETWTLRYDQNEQGWWVTGGVSGLQSELAREDERYLSDNGEISFVVRAGATASRDGWTMTFNVLNGAAEATGDNDLDGIAEFVLGISSDPVYFEYRVGLPGPIGDASGEGWLPVDVRPFVLVPASSANGVGRVDPQEAQIEVGWE